MKKNRTSSTIRQIAVLATTTVIIASCSIIGRKINGDDYFEQKNYYKATLEYEKEILKLPKDSVYRKAHISYQLGESYLQANKLQLAEKWYREAVSYGVLPFAKLGYGDVLKRNGKYFQAIEIYEEYKEEEEDPDIARANFAILGCNRALEWMNDPVKDYEIRIPKYLNTEYSDYAPSYFGNNIVFSSHRKKATGATVYGWSGEKFSDLYIAKLNGEGHAKLPLPLGVEYNINSKFHEGASTFSYDSTEIFFTRCGTQDKSNIDYCQIYHSKALDHGLFTIPKRVQLFSDSSIFNVGQPSLSEDGKKLYFSSEVPNKGYGGKDIYVAYRVGDEWSKPINLGPAINTPGDEMYPFINRDGKLYFSSNGHIGMGGLDIFEAVKFGNRWRIRNMKYPLNSGADDFGLTLQDSEVLNESGYYVTNGFFTSTRKGGQGSDDIYGVTLLRDAFYFLNVVIYKKVHFDEFDPTSRVIDYAPLEECAVQIYANDTLVEVAETDESGVIRYKLRPNKEYKVVAVRDGYMSQSEYIPPVNYQTTNQNKIIHVDAELILEQSFAQDQFITVQNIYYDFDAWYIRDDAGAELDSLAQLIKDNPQLTKVEIGSHTDSRGSYAYNEKLSQKRAEACVKYMITKGIDKDRLIAKGYGESKLVNECNDANECSEEQHQKNRRTTFRIITEDFDLVSVEPEDIMVDYSYETGESNGDQFDDDSYAAAAAKMEAEDNSPSKTIEDQVNKIMDDLEAEEASKEPELSEEEKQKAAELEKAKEVTKSGGEIDLSQLIELVKDDEDVGEARDLEEEKRQAEAAKKAKEEKLRKEKEAEEAAKAEAERKRKAEEAKQRAAEAKRKAAEAEQKRQEEEAAAQAVEEAKAQEEAEAKANEPKVEDITDQKEEAPKDIAKEVTESTELDFGNILNALSSSTSNPIEEKKEDERREQERQKQIQMNQQRQNAEAQKQQEEDRRRQEEARKQQERERQAELDRLRQEDEAREVARLEQEAADRAAEKKRLEEEKARQEKIQDQKREAQRDIILNALSTTYEEPLPVTSESVKNGYSPNDRAKATKSVKMEAFTMEGIISSRFKEDKDYVIAISSEDTLINQIVTKEIFMEFEEGDFVKYNTSGEFGNYEIKELK